MRYRPRRTLIEQALLLAQDSEKGRPIVLADENIPGNSVSIDAALLIIMKVEYFRGKSVRRECGDDLRALVHQVTRSTGFDPGRRYAYELVIMRYYNLLSQFAQRLRRRRKERRRKERKAPELVLTSS